MYVRIGPNEIMLLTLKHSYNSDSRNTIGMT